MIRALVVTAIVSLVQPAVGVAAPLPNSQGAASFARVDGRWQPLWFLCDAADARELYLISRPAGGRVTIARHALPSLKRTGFADYALGDGDPGAGNVYFPLRIGGRDAGNLHAINAGMIDPPPRVPSFTSVALGQTRRECRTAPGTLLIAITPRRTVMVSQESGQLIYRAFALTGANRLKPLLVVTGGNTIAGGWQFRNEGYAYRLTASAAGGGAVTILKGSRVIGIEPLLAYSVAAR